MPFLKHAGSRRRQDRRRSGDWLAVGLLLALLGGGGWLWWRQTSSSLSKHPSKNSMPVRKTDAAGAKILRPPVMVLTTNIPNPATSARVEVKAATSPEEFQPATMQVVRVAGANHVSEYPRHPKEMIEAQIALSRQGISPGPVDGTMGSQTRAAIASFQRMMNVSDTGILDASTRSLLVLNAPVLTNYLVTSNDLARLQPLGRTWLAKSQQSALEYETVLEMVAEKAHAHPLLVQRLNPAVNWSNISPSTEIVLPFVAYAEPTEESDRVVIHLAGKFLEVFGTSSNLIFHCPCSIAAKVEKRPVGVLKVSVVAPNPNYTFDPAVFPESTEAQELGRKLILQPGPNNPVGVAWIGLDRPGYGIHGTPAPEQVGRSESHGCFRLANWDAEYLLKLVWIGMPVEVVP